MKMSTAKVAITLDENILRQLDRLVKNRVFENRSRAIQEAVREKLSRLERDRLARECAKLDRKFEQTMAEEGLSVEVEEWPEY
jgi:metal-responsive CopG/Arc/MetJ family transcriptional regulator